MRQIPQMHGLFLASEVFRNTFRWTVFLIEEESFRKAALSVQFEIEEHTAHVPSDMPTGTDHNFSLHSSHTTSSRGSTILPSTDQNPKYFQKWLFRLLRVQITLFAAEFSAIIPMQLLYISLVQLDLHFIYNVWKWCHVTPVKQCS